MSNSPDADIEAPGICAPRCPRCGWQAVDRPDDREGRVAAKTDVIAHRAVCPGGTSLAEKCQACREGVPAEIASCTCLYTPVEGDQCNS